MEHIKIAAVRITIPTVSRVNSFFEAFSLQIQDCLVGKGRKVGKSPQMGPDATDTLETLMERRNVK